MASSRLIPASAAPAWISWASSGISCSSAAWSDGLETAFEAGVGEQLPGHLDVLDPLRRLRRVEERHERGEDVVVGDLGPPLEQRADHLLAVERVGQRLAHGLVDELAGVAAHPDLAVRRGLHLEHGEVGAVEQGLAAEHGELHEGVDGAALHRRHHRADVAEELHLLAVERGLAAPPVGVALERGPGRRVVAGRASTARCRWACRRAWCPVS